MFVTKTAADQAAAELLGIEYIETVGWFTYGGQVVPFAGHTPQRWDLAHLTPEYALLLAKPLDEALFGVP